jgi:hypothetical protein
MGDPKFRYWNVEEKAYTYLDKWSGLDRSNFWTLYYYDLQEGNAILEQFTGLPDKNGKEIYEGDVDEDGNAVEFLNGSFVLVNMEYGDIVLLSNHNETIKIIGNIHETQ